MTHIINAFFSPAGTSGTGEKFVRDWWVAGSLITNAAEPFTSRESSPTMVYLTIPHLSEAEAIFKARLISPREMGLLIAQFGTTAMRADQPIAAE